jgi:hypothetical protein
LKKNSNLKLNQNFWQRIEVNDGKINQKFNDKNQTLERQLFKMYSLGREDSFLKIKQDKLFLFLSPFLPS